MKNLIIYVILLLFNVFMLNGQNLVPNADFEEYLELPDNFAQYYKASGWSNVNNNPSGPPFGSPDYFHADGYVSTFFGQIDAQSGSGQMGMCTYHGTLYNFREYVSIELENPLIEGRPYKLSFFLSTGSGGTYANNTANFGVVFSEKYLRQEVAEVIRAEPIIEIDEIISHEGYWQEYRFEFTAENNAKFITFGNFRDDENTQKEGFGSAYYFLDNIELLADFTISLNEPNCNLFVPNSFTPNKDGINDYFKPLTECEVLDYEFNIFNRWGDLVFQTSNMEESWNGQNGGREVTPGMYTYKLSYSFYEGQEEEKRGTLYLVR